MPRRQSDVAGPGTVKLIVFETGMNLTLGLPLIRIPPDHGTAYDIAVPGQGKPLNHVGGDSAGQATCRSASGGPFALGVNGPAGAVWRVRENPDQ